MIMGVLEDWGITAEELSAILMERPSLRGLLVGYLAEYKLQRSVFSDARIHKLIRHDDHNRKRPADFSFEYRGRKFTVEVKSLQSGSVRKLNGSYEGRCQVDASDRRSFTLPDGSTVDTTCLLAGQFDILAVSLFEFRQKWEYAFISNDNLPRSTYSKYSDYQRRHLLSTTVKLKWPLERPFHSTPFTLLEELRHTKPNGA